MLNMSLSALWFFLGIFLLFLAAGCFGMARGSFVPTGQKVVGLVFGLSLCLTTFFMLVIFANLIKEVALPLVILAAAIGWFEEKVSKFFFNMKARSFDRKAPDK